MDQTLSLSNDFLILLLHGKFDLINTLINTNGTNEASAIIRHLTDAVILRCLILASVAAA